MSRVRDNVNRCNQTTYDFPPEMPAGAYQLRCSSTKSCTSDLMKPSDEIEQSMKSSSAVIRQIPREDEAPPLAGAPDFGWYLLGHLGTAFAMVGLLDVVLTWVPFAFGDAEWEFGTVSSSMDALPVATLGLGLMLGAAVARGKRGMLRSLSVGYVLIALLIIAAALLYVTEIPLALRAMQEPTMAFAMKKAVIKTSAQLVVYPSLFLWLGFTAWRHASKQSTR